jgi:D-alanyl-lipoteichoic acid acyltransferase DltB (MBOAT superfamily)
MQFNSVSFLLFLPVVFSLHWALQRRSLRLQNSLLLLASYVFYGWWDWRFLSLLVFSSTLDYTVARAVECSANKRRRVLLLILSLAGNLGVLGFFKYYGFFVQSLVQVGYTSSGSGPFAGRGPS